MLNLRYAYVIFCSFLFSCSGAKYLSDPGLETGVSRELAKYRRSVLSNINYKLELDVPAEKDQDIAATEALTFKLSANTYPLQLDFKEDSRRIADLRVNGNAVGIVHNVEHLIIEISKPGTECDRY